MKRNMANESRPIFLACFISPPRKRCRIIQFRDSIQRFNLDDRRAMVAADPQCAGFLRIIDVNAANIGWVRQHVFRVLAAANYPSERRKYLREMTTGDGNDAPRLPPRVTRPDASKPSPENTLQN